MVEKNKGPDEEFAADGWRFATDNLGDWRWHRESGESLPGVPFRSQAFSSLGSCVADARRFGYKGPDRRPSVDTAADAKPDKYQSGDVLSDLSRNADGALVLPLPRIERLVDPKSYRQICLAFPEGLPLAARSFEVLSKEYKNGCGQGLLITVLPSVNRDQVAMSAVRSALGYLAKIFEQHGAISESAAMGRAASADDIKDPALRNALKLAHDTVWKLRNDELKLWTQAEPRGPRDGLDEIDKFRMPVQFAMEALDKTPYDRAYDFTNLRDRLAWVLGVVERSCEESYDLLIPAVEEAATRSSGISS